MQKKFFFKLVAVIVCVAFIALAVPCLNSAEKKVQKSKTTLLLKRPALFLLSLFPSLSSFLDSDDQFAIYNPSRATSNKPTGDVQIPQPSKGD